MKNDSIWVGFDPREADGFAVTRASIQNSLNIPIPVRGIILDHLRKMGVYNRPTRIQDGRLWDVISDAPMATEFACSRFLTPHLANHMYGGEAGLACFMDSDMLVRTSMDSLFSWIRQQPNWEQIAVWCVKHNHVPASGVKMDNQIQTIYGRKNWSSVMVFNCQHPSNRKLSLDLVNQVPGRDLHRFCWLDDSEIGGLAVEWNYLVGVNEPVQVPNIVHFTEGLPSMAGYAEQPYADEWRSALHSWAWK